MVFWQQWTSLVLLIKLQQLDFAQFIRIPTMSFQAVVLPAQYQMESQVEVNQLSTHTLWVSCGTQQKQQLNTFTQEYYQTFLLIPLLIKSIWQ
jgi:hypothetical protein